MNAVWINSPRAYNFPHLPDPLVDLSSVAGPGEKALPFKPSSPSCSRRTVVYFESRTNFGTES
jgi:hypothetical protein